MPVTCSCNAVCYLNTNAGDLTPPGCTCNVDTDPPESQPTAKCDANQTVWTALTQNVTEIDNSHVSELRTALDNEYTRRNYVRLGAARKDGWDSNTTLITANSATYTRPMSGNLIIEDGDIEELYTQINAMKVMVWTTNVQFPLKNVKITKNQVDELRSKLNDCEDDCLCDCDYCACNCFYCTCDCNNCPCNVNYGCPCNCNNCCDGGCGCDCIYSYGCPGQCCGNGCS